MKLRQYKLSSSLRSVLGVFWVDIPFVVIRGYKRFGRGCYLHPRVRTNSYLLIMSLVSYRSWNVHESTSTGQQENKNVKNINVDKSRRIREGSCDHITLYYTAHCIKAHLRHCIARQRLSDRTEIPREAAINHLITAQNKSPGTISVRMSREEQFVEETFPFITIGIYFPLHSKSL
jgi:hypothetical protein